MVPLTRCCRGYFFCRPLAVLQRVTWIRFSQRLPYKAKLFQGMPFHLRAPLSLIFFREISWYLENGPFVNEQIDKLIRQGHFIISPVQCGISNKNSTISDSTIHVLAAAHSQILHHHQCPSRSALTNHTPPLTSYPQHLPILHHHPYPSRRALNNRTLKSMPLLKPFSIVSHHTHLMYITLQSYS